MSFSQDFKERFMNFETAKGLYLIPSGIIIVAVTLLWMQYLIQACGILFGVYLIVEGVRKVAVNRVKQKLARDALIAERQAQMAAADAGVGGE